MGAAGGDSGISRPLGTGPRPVPAPGKPGSSQDAPGCGTGHARLTAGWGPPRPACDCAPAAGRRSPWRSGQRAAIYYAVEAGRPVRAGRRHWLAVVTRRRAPARGELHCSSPAWRRTAVSRFARTRRSFPAREKLPRAPLDPVGAGIPCKPQIF